MSYRTRLGGELRAEDAGSRVTLAGWVARRRDHGGLVFVDLRDSAGLVQLVFDPADQPEAHATAHELRNEFVVQVEGVVAPRSAETINPKLPTGQVEVRADRLTVLARAGVLPFQLDEDGVDESLRLHHRYLDLRRDRMRHNIWTRFKLTQTIRRHMEDNGFWELETPILYKSTPEGAREFVVPTSSHPGKFYALPQSPQTFKQLYAISGFERYYQIAKCFRDEATRADRTQEFTQLDIEMAFLEPDELFSLLEELLGEGVARGAGRRAGDAVPADELGRGDAALRLGQARPAVRLRDRRRHRRAARHRVQGVRRRDRGRRRRPRVRRAGRARVLAQGLRRPGRVRQDVGRQGRRLAAGDGRRDPLADRQVPVAGGAGRDRRRGRRGRAATRSSWWPTREEAAVRVLGPLRLHLGERLGLVGDGWQFLWVTGFPMFEWLPDENRWKAAHNPFSAPAPEFLETFDADPPAARSCQYDLVLNGNEIGGGSIRNHRPEVQRRIFELLGITEERAEQNFSFLLRALSMGAPPHGGIAFGLDRLAMLLAGRRLAARGGRLPQGPGRRRPADRRTQRGLGGAADRGRAARRRAADVKNGGPDPVPRSGPRTASACACTARSAARPTA